MQFYFGLLKLRFVHWSLRFSQFLYQLYDAKFKYSLKKHAFLPFTPSNKC